MTIIILIKMKDEILNIIKVQKSITAREICNKFKISRQAVNKHINRLISEGKIYKRGITKGVKYYFGENPFSEKIKISKIFNLSDLSEDKVFNKIDKDLRINKKINKNSYEIFRYCFTEILNNATDHSKSDKCSVNLYIDKYIISFIIRDFGIGIFNSINKFFNLKSEEEAVGELLKGKVTTQKDKHSGEGIFFSSKAADKLIIRSHNNNLIFDTKNHDIFIQKKPFIKGTEVIFEVSRNKKKNLNNVFIKFAGEEFEYKFKRTTISVKLYKENFISRSEAKRILNGLEKFEEIIFDFSKVTSIGQGFSDEICRVFLKRNKEIKIKITNVNKEILTMLLHVVDNKLKSRLTIC